MASPVAVSPQGSPLERQSDGTPAVAASAGEAEEPDLASRRFSRSTHKKAWLRMRDLWVADRKLDAACADDPSTLPVTWAQRRQQARVEFQQLDPPARCEVAQRAAALCIQRGECEDVVQCLLQKSLNIGDVTFIDRKSSALLTYNGPWGLLVDVCPPPALFAGQHPADAVAQWLMTQQCVQDLWKKYVQRVTAIADAMNCVRWSAGLEVCPKAVCQQTVRIHAHLFLECSQAVTIRSADALRFEGVRPHISTDEVQHLRGRGRAARTAAAAGHYYVRAPKVGKLLSCGTHQPYEDYAIKAEWVTAYWQAGKLTDEQAINEFLKVKRDCARNIQNVRDNVRLREQLATQTQSDAVQRRLSAAKRPRAYVAEVERDFLPQFQNTQLSRRKFLVLEGRSCVGKTEYARGLVSGPHELLELNCANQSQHVDLRALSPGTHKLVLWDEASPQLILNNKKLIQGQACQVQLGQTNTSCHSYAVFPWGVMMVVCFNNWSTALRSVSVEDEKWLRANSVHVKVTKPLWVEPCDE